MREGESRFGNRAAGPPLAAMNSTVEDTAKVVLERVGVDDRAAYFLLLMSGIAAGTCVVGTLILMLATYRSRRALLSSSSSEGRQEPSVMGAPASPQDVRLTMPREPLRGPQTQPQQVSPKRRFRQVLATFFGTFGLCIAVVIDGIIHNTLSKDTGLSWESYTLLLTAGCCWMLIQAGVLAVQLEPGRGYSFTSFGEAMLGGIAPFIADSFDTLKDTLFGGFCFLSEKSGLHVLGGISWAYLALFHVCLMFQGRFLAEMFSNHLSVFALATQDLKSKSAGLSHTEKAMALIGKQLARTKRQLLLVENIPQAGFAIIFLAVEGGSVVVALLNLAIPALQVLVSVCFYGRVQKRLAGWYAQRLDAAMDDGDPILRRRLCGELLEGGHELQAQVAPLSKHLGAIVTASARERSDLNHVVMAGELDDTELRVCRECLVAGYRTNGELFLREQGLGGRPALLKAVTAFALHSPWVEGVDLRSNGITSDAAVAVAVALHTGGALSMLSLYKNSLQDQGAEALAAALPNISGLRWLDLYNNGIADAGARAVAAKLPECLALDFLDMSGNAFGEEAKEALRKACREHKPKIELMV